jgi:NAD(P)-dependent dehydrogenase (short-subunit alcohol dehydrogenase family)
VKLVRHLPFNTAAKESNWTYLTSALEYATRGIRINAICPGFNVVKGISGFAEVKEHVIKTTLTFKKIRTDCKRLYFPFLS